MIIFENNCNYFQIFSDITSLYLFKMDNFRGLYIKLESKDLNLIEKKEVLLTENLQHLPLATFDKKSFIW